MILDEYISFHNKVIISILVGGIWIYFRTIECYAFIPNHHIFPVVFVMVWIYLNYYEPLFLPIGLCVLLAFTFL